jgi:hypothetical protein
MKTKTIVKNASEDDTFRSIKERLLLFSLFHLFKFVFYDQNLVARNSCTLRKHKSFQFHNRHSLMDESFQINVSMQISVFVKRLF